MTNMVDLARKLPELRRRPGAGHMPLLAVLSGTGAGQKDHKTRFSSDRSLCLLMAYADAAEFLRDKLSGIVYGMWAWFRNGDWLRTE